MKGSWTRDWGSTPSQRNPLLIVMDFNGRAPALEKESTVRGILRLTIAIVFCVSSGFGQGGQQVQTGFVVLTPVVGFGQGLIVFGRFAYRAGDDLFQGTGWAGSVVASSAIVVSADSSSGQDTGIAIVNPSNLAANITLTLKNQDGRTVATRTLVLNARRQISQYVTELLNQVNVSGLLTITSTAPIAVVGFQFKGASFHVIPTNAPLGGTALVLPQFVSGGGWSTELVIGNTAGTEQTVRIDFYNPAGGILATLPNVRIPGGGVTVVNR
ncbi:MAG TPA: hypothetical protein VE422_08700 [Terriglobia bacterium]|nr:hypothetical protein [Terriglobia bacterium]